MPKILAALLINRCCIKRFHPEKAKVAFTDHEDGSFAITWGEKGGFYLLLLSQIEGQGFVLEKELAVVAAGNILIIDGEKMAILGKSFSLDVVNLGDGYGSLRIGESIF